jgi:hypothetical protein
MKADRRRRNRLVWPNCGLLPDNPVRQVGDEVSTRGGGEGFEGDVPDVAEQPLALASTGTSQRELFDIGTQIEGLTVRPVLV